MNEIPTTSESPTGAAGVSATHVGAVAVPAPEPQSERTFTQADLDRIVTARLAEQKQRDAAALTKATAAAEEKVKLETGQSQAVLEERAARITALEAQHTTAAERVAALEKVIRDQVGDRVKALPASLQALRPSGDVALELVWLALAEKAADDMNPQTNRTPGTPSGPRGNGSAPQPNTTAIDTKRRDAGYGV